MLIQVVIQGSGDKRDTNDADVLLHIGIVHFWNIAEVSNRCLWLV